MADDEEYYDDDFEDEGDEDEDDFEFGDDAEIDAEVEGEIDEDEKESKLEEEYLTDQEDDDDLTDFQKMLNQKQKQDFRTPNRITKYEFAALLGFRSQQIAEGAPPYVDAEGMTDTSAIALKELNEGFLPLVVERPLPSNKIGRFSYEIRTLNELINVNQLT